MGVEVLSRLRQALSQHVSGSSLAGDGMLVRIRSTSIALLSLVTAIGLGLIIFIAQQGWPEVFSGAIPAAPRAAVVHNDTIVLPPAGSTGGPAGRPAGGTAGGASAGSTASPRHAPSTDGGSALAGSRQVVADAPSAHTAPVAAQPSPTPAPSPAQVETTPPPAPAPQPVANPAPETSVGGGGNSIASGPLGEVVGGKHSGGRDQKGDGPGSSHGPSTPILSGLTEGGSAGHSHSHSHQNHSPEPKEAPPAPTEPQVAPPPQPPAAVPSEGRGSEGKGAGSSKGNEKPGRDRH
jgi:hypothetical protein